MLVWILCLFGCGNLGLGAFCLVMMLWVYFVFYWLVWCIRWLGVCSVLLVVRCWFLDVVMRGVLPGFASVCWVC